jgi:fimbrial chaperone protein
MALASGLQVSPIMLQLPADAPAAALWLSNTGNETLHAQVRVFRWTQVEGADKLEASRDVIVSPPMLAIEPGQRQLVRVIRQGSLPTGAESAYRLVVDELPVDGDVADSRQGLRFVLRYSIPVFVQPVDGTKMQATLHARVVNDEGGPALQVHNSGTSHAQLADLAMHGAQGNNVSLRTGLVGYALPGSTMTWKLPQPVATGASVRARINGDASASTLALDAGDR